MIAAKPRILCIDDEPNILKFLEAVLVRNGYEVLQTENGEEALEKIEKQGVDLVLSDVRMPKMDGLQVCRRIKGDERFRNIPVILITGLAEKEDRIKGIEAGAEDFLSKPIDSAEVLARIKMLLKVKALNEKRIGDLLIEMKFITEQQLQEALRLSKEQHIKVGEALYSMGALDKDHIYWVLSNQLKMNYIELCPEMLDQDLIRQFPIHLLEELVCIPLYETGEEVHIAMADPTDQQIVSQVKNLRPEKTVQLHLAMPDKIRDVLNSVKQRFSPVPQAGKQTPLDEGLPPPTPARIVSLRPLSKSESAWADFISTLLSLPQGEVLWFILTPQECRLAVQRGRQIETLLEFSEEDSLFIQERLDQKRSSLNQEGKGRLFLAEKSLRKQGAFRLWQLDCFDRKMIRIEGVPTFSREAFLLSHPQASGLTESLRDCFREPPGLLLGGQDRLWVKQSCYLCLADEGLVKPLLPSFFIENEMEIYFPRAAQISKEHFHQARFFSQFKEEARPSIFYEAEFRGEDTEASFLSEIFSGTYKNIVICLPFLSIEAMKGALSERQDWRHAGFRALFLDRDQWKSL